VEQRDAFARNSWDWIAQSALGRFAVERLEEALREPRLAGSQRREIQDASSIRRVA
jgi:hypothetical protein